MSIVKNGKVTTNDQQVDKDKFDSNYDTIRWKSKEVSPEQPDREAKDG